MASSAQLLELVQKATRRLASSGNFDELLRDVLAICVEAVNAVGGTFYIHDPDARRLRFQHVLPDEVQAKLPDREMPDDYGMAGEAFQKRRPVVHDFPAKAESDWNEFERTTGVQVRSMLSVPLMLEGEEPVGVVQLINKRNGCFDDTDEAVLAIIASVCAMAFVNAKLTEESMRASTLLGMGKVSHDIGNLAVSLHATLGFAENPLGAVENALDGKDIDQGRLNLSVLKDSLSDLKLSTDRLVGYANLISDLSAGRPLRPVFKLGKMGETIESAALYLESEARKRHIELSFDLQDSKRLSCYDDLFLFRIVQNLVGNAIKAVREVTHEDEGRRLQPGQYLGKVTIRYRETENCHILEVQDTGLGMTPEVARQIVSGNARSMWAKAGGSGWGTKIVRELAASHEAKLEIFSELGHGSAFRVVFPHRGECA